MRIISFSYHLVSFIFIIFSARIISAQENNIPNIDNVLFPLLSGLFGFSVLFLSLMQNTSVPSQKTDVKLDLDLKDSGKAVVGATSVGFMASFLPGLGSSQAAIIATQFLREIGDKGFMVLVGGINTVNFTLSLITLYVLDKARNGAVLAMTEIVGRVELVSLFVYLFFMKANK